MSVSSTTGVPVGGATTDPGANPPQAPTFYQQLALKTIEALIAALQFFPKLQTAHPDDKVQGVRRRLNIDPNVIVTAAAAAEQSSELQVFDGFSVAAARDAAQFIEAYRPVIARAKAMVVDMEFSVDAVQADATKAALDLYDFAKSLARNPGSQVAPHVENMKRDVKRKGRKKRVAPTTPSTPTQPITAGEEVPAKAA